MSYKLLQPGDHPADNRDLARLIGSSRYFRSLSQDIIERILAYGTQITLPKDSYLMREGDDSPHQMYLLVSGSLAVVTGNRFILRLDLPGDVVGEMGIIQSAPRSADVIAEKDCHLIVFPSELFAIDEDSQQASILYVLTAHIMAAKLRYTTAQSLIRKNQRVVSNHEIQIGVIDVNADDRTLVRQSVANSWPDASVIEIEDPQQFIDRPTAWRFDYLVADPSVFGDPRANHCAMSSFIKAMKLQGADILVLSALCDDPDIRKYLIEQGVEEMIAKPCTSTDLEHIVSKFRVWYYKNLELDEIENAAQTDRLTGLANRRRLDEFLHALVAVYPDNNSPFSLLICDVDDFKHYNDNQGHLMGDRVLKDLAKLFADNTRRGDLAARYGGEEFVIVLLDCDKARAVEVAEGLRQAVARAHFPNQEQQPGGNLTATFGVATYPEDASDLNQLLQLADDSLYTGKQRGRNTVVASP